MIYEYKLIIEQRAWNNFLKAWNKLLFKLLIDKPKRRLCAILARQSVAINNLITTMILTEADI